MNGPVGQIILFTTLAGAAIPAGGWLARIERIGPRWLETELRHAIIAFGGGVLLAAVSLVLVPKGIGSLDLPWAAGCFAAGGVAFMLFDHWLARRRASAPQLVAMLADFLPEAVALGAMFATDRQLGILLALLIGLQNLPEGFNAWRELSAAGGRARRAPLLWLLVLVPLGPASGLAGHLWLAGHPEAIGAIMLAASGGILYLTFQDIAPQARLQRHWSPPLGAVAGFLLGMIGHMLLPVH